MRISKEYIARNRAPILEVLQAWLPPSGLLLEVASGTGEHARYFADGLPGWRIQPTDRTDDELAAIEAWREGGPDRLLPPLRFDVLGPAPVPRADAMLAINLIHIAPWEVCVALMGHAGRLLGPGGQLVTYGPYKVDGAHTAPSNADFDAWLKARDPAFGVRDREAVVAEAARVGLTLQAAVPMPANNQTLVFRRG